MALIYNYQSVLHSSSPCNPHCTHNGSLYNCRKACTHLHLNSAALNSDMGRSKSDKTVPSTCDKIFIKKNATNDFLHLKLILDINEYIFDTLFEMSVIKYSCELTCLKKKVPP